MNLRWLLFDYADPDLPLSFWKRQKLIWRRIPMQSMPRSIRRRKTGFGLIVVLPMVAATILMPFLGLQFIQFDRAGIWVFPAMMISLIPLSWIWICIAYVLLLRPEHYYRIRIEGFDVCLGCGYWLRGLDETIKACPECGTERLAFDEDKPTNTESE